MSNYKADLEIDINNLDEACVKQPILFDMYSQDLIPLYKERDNLKLFTDQTYARLDGMFREAYSANGVKITEAKIQNEIKNNAEYVNMQKKFIELSTEIHEKESVKQAFMQRKDMLKLLTEQYISGYWSTVETKVVKNRVNEAIKNKVANKLKEDREKKGI